MKTLMKGLATAVLLSGATIANAGLITGEISFAGGWVPLEEEGGAVTTANAAKYVDICTTSACSNIATVSDSPTGDLGSFIDFADLAVYNDFAIDPFSSVTPLWKVGGFEFDLTAITGIIRTPASAGVSASLALTGSGFLRCVAVGAGTCGEKEFHETAFAWSFSGDSSGTKFAFSATNAPLSVAEPASLSLLGLGLVALGLIRRRVRPA